MKKTQCEFCSKWCTANNILTHSQSCSHNPNRTPGRSAGKRHSEVTKRQIGRSNKTHRVPKNILDVSKRTTSKILKRLSIGCSRCGWNEASCDVHHIILRSKGGTDDHSNLTLLCPNCHRLAHAGIVTEFVSLVDQIGDLWKDAYYSDMV